MHQNYQPWWRSFRLLLVTTALAAVAACGGGGGSEPIAGPPAGSGSLPLTVEVVGVGNITSQPNGLNCTSGVCKGDFASNTVVTLTATPGAEQSFSGWSGACTGAANTCLVTVDPALTVAQSVTARFVPNAGQSAYPLSLAIAGAGTVVSQPAGIDCTANCIAVFPATTQVTLTAIPAAGQSFAGWTGACTGAATSCTVTQDQARTVGATFRTITDTSFALNVAVSGNGSVASSPPGVSCGSVCSASFAAGTAVTLTATPSAGHRFTSWGGACTGTQPTCTLQLTQVRAVQAAFAVASQAGSAFQTPQLLETNNDFNVGRKLVAINSSGDSFAVWEQSDGVPDGSTYKVYSRRYAAATGWQSAVVIAGLTRRDSNPSVITGKLLMDDAGVASWINVDMQTRRNSPTTGWDSAFNAPSGDSGGGLTSAVMDSSGGIAVLSSGSNVYYNTLAAGASSWAAWQRIDTSGSLVAWKAELALSNNGTALAVWHESNPGDANYSMKSAHWVRGTGWGAPQSIETLTANLNEEPPKVVMDDQGNGIAMWLQNVNGISVFYNTYRAGSGWQGEVRVDNPPDRIPAIRDLQLAMTADGRAVATWAGQRSLFSMQYSAATLWSAPVIVTPDFCEQINSSQTKISNTGQAVTVYVAFNVCEAKTQGVSRSLNIGGQWSAAATFTAGAGGYGATTFVMNRSGQGVAFWDQGDQSGADQRKSLWAAALR